MNTTMTHSMDNTSDPTMLKQRPSSRDAMKKSKAVSDGTPLAPCGKPLQEQPPPVDDSSSPRKHPESSTDLIRREVACSFNDGILEIFVFDTRMFIPRHQNAIDQDEDHVVWSFGDEDDDDDDDDEEEEKYGGHADVDAMADDGDEKKEEGDRGNDGRNLAGDDLLDVDVISAVDDGTLDADEGPGKATTPPKRSATPSRKTTSSSDDKKLPSHDLADVASRLLSTERSHHNSDVPFRKRSSVLFRTTNACVEIYKFNTRFRIKNSSPAPFPEGFLGLIQCEYHNPVEPQPVQASPHPPPPPHSLLPWQTSPYYPPPPSYHHGHHSHAPSGYYPHFANGASQQPPLQLNGNPFLPMGGGGGADQEHHPSPRPYDQPVRSNRHQRISSGVEMSESEDAVTRKVPRKTGKSSDVVKENKRSHSEESNHLHPLDEERSASKSSRKSSSSSSSSRHSRQRSVTEENGAMETKLVGKKRPRPDDRTKEEEEEESSAHDQDSETTNSRRHSKSLKKTARTHRKEQQRSEPVPLEAPPPTKKVPVIGARRPIANWIKDRLREDYMAEHANDAVPPTKAKIAAYVRETFTDNQAHLLEVYKDEYEEYKLDHERQKKLAQAASKSSSKSSSEQQHKLSSSSSKSSRDPSKENASSSSSTKRGGGGGSSNKKSSSPSGASSKRNSSTKQHRESNSSSSSKSRSDDGDTHRQSKNPPSSHKGGQRIGASNSIPAPQKILNFDRIYLYLEEQVVAAIGRSHYTFDSDNARLYLSQFNIPRDIPFMELLSRLVTERASLKRIARECAVDYDDIITNCSDSPAYADSDMEGPEEDEEDEHDQSLADEENSEEESSEGCSTGDEMRGSERENTDDREFLDDGKSSSMDGDDDNDPDNRSGSSLDDYQSMGETRLPSKRIVTTAKEHHQSRQHTTTTAGKKPVSSTPPQTPSSSKLNSFKYQGKSSTSSSHDDEDDDRMEESPPSHGGVVNAKKSQFVTESPSSSKKLRTISTIASSNEEPQFFVDKDESSSVDFSDDDDVQPAPRREVNKSPQRVVRSLPTAPLQSRASPIIYSGDDSGSEESSSEQIMNVN